MKIGHPADKPLPRRRPPARQPRRPRPRKAGAGARRAAAPPRPVDASATVALSSTARRCSRAAPRAEFDADKVARIGGAIADGSFKINPEAIADKLIANAQELLTKVQG